MNPPQGIEVIPETGEWVVAGDSHLGMWAKQHGTIVSDKGLMRFLEPLMRGVEVIWDLGGNIGDHTRQYADWGKKVVAFEPNPLAFVCLEHNVPEAMCYNLAVSDSPGELRFSVLENVGASRVTPNGEMIVQAVKLDDMDLSTPDWVKIDCEGFELNILRGMERVLKDHKPTLFFEANAGALSANGHSTGMILEFLKSIGYSDFSLYPPTASWDDAQFDVLAR